MSIARCVRQCLYAQRHDTVDDVVVVLLESLDGLLSADAGLCHDKLNVLGLKTGVINLLAVILLLLSGLLASITLNSLALVGTLGGVVVRSLVGGLGRELLSCRSLRLRVEILDLGLAEDAVITSVFASCPTHTDNALHPGVAVRGLVDIRAADNKEDVLGSPKSDTCDSLNVLQTELRNRLACLLLVPAVHSDLSTSWDVGITTLLIRVRGLLLYILHLLLRLIDNLFDTWVGHSRCCSRGWVVELRSLLAV